jgi:hypothetical protein
VGAQFDRIAGEHGQAVTWRQYVSASTGTSSAYYGGGGTTRYYREQTITGLIAAPRMGESRFREYSIFGGQVLAGDIVVSLPHEMDRQDELIWRGTTYRVESDSTPITQGGTTWYRALMRRGDVTG